VSCGSQAESEQSGLEQTGFATARSPEPYKTVVLPAEGMAPTVTLEDTDPEVSISFGESWLVSVITVNRATVNYPATLTCGDTVVLQTSNGRHRDWYFECQGNEVLIKRSERY